VIVRVRTAFGLGLLLVTACAARKPAGSPGDTAGAQGGAATGSAAPASVDVDALLARESSGLKEQVVAGPGGRFTVRALGAGPAVVAAAEGVAVVDIPIGSQTPVRCQVFPEDVDAGGTLANLFGQAAKKVEVQRIAPWSLAVAHESPVAFVRAIYLTRGSQRAVGEVKAALHAAAGHPVLCLHDELGFEKTFMDVVTRFCESIEHGGAKPPEPSFVEIQHAKIKGSPVGFAKVQVIEQDGVRRVIEATTMMLPIAANEIRFQDQYQVQTLDRAGLLVSGAWAESTGGQLGTNVKLELTKGHTYRYEGQVQGKKIEGTFTTKDGKLLPSVVSSAKLLARHAKGAEPFSLLEAGYHPDLDPTAPYPFKYLRIKGDAARSARMEGGSIRMEGVLDERGLFEQAHMGAASTTVDFDRAFLRGSL
jgi:hypothetical protein